MNAKDKRSNLLRQFVYHGLVPWRIKNNVKLGNEVFLKIAPNTIFVYFKIKYLNIF